MINSNTGKLYKLNDLNFTAVSGPILDKKCDQLSDFAPSPEILTKIYFTLKALKKV